MRHEARRHIPSTAGRNSEGGSWIRWLTWTRKRKGTVACQKSNGRAQAYETRCCGIRVIRRKLDCLYPNLQEMQVEHPPERRLKPVPRRVSVWRGDRCNLRGVEQFPV